MDMYKRGWTTVQLKVCKPTPEYPNGGTYNRLEKKLLVKGETWDSVVGRLLDRLDELEAALVDDGK
jgi:hypothetical protein